MLSNDDDFENFVRITHSKGSLKRRITAQNEGLKKIISDKNNSSVKDLTEDVNITSLKSPIAPSRNKPPNKDSSVNSNNNSSPIKGKSSDPTSPNRYSDDTTGQCYVFIEVCNNNLEKPFRLNSDLFFFEHIKDLKLDGLINIKTISNGKAKLGFATAVDANNFIINNDFGPKSCKAYIPRIFTEKFGIVKNIPPSIKEEDFLNSATSDIEIISVTRILRRDPADREMFIPTNSLKIGFKGKLIPKSIKFNYCNIPVDYFIPSVRLCYNCGRFGHIAKFCKSKESRCLNCGKSPACPTDSCLSIKCLGCGSLDHNVTFRECSKRKKEENLKKILTIQNLSFREYKEKFSNNPYNLLENYDVNFPAMKDSNAPNNIRDPTIDTNNILINKNFNAVLKNKTSIPKSLHRMSLKTPSTYSNKSQEPKKPTPPPEKHTFINYHKSTDMEIILEKIFRILSISSQEDMLKTIQTEISSLKSKFDLLKQGTCGSALSCSNISHDVLPTV
ncbi:uncharacterized protein ACN427_013357 isoform 1-T4 [Glossina fuscipes fuscipes]